MHASICKSFSALTQVVRNERFAQVHGFESWQSRLAPSPLHVFGRLCAFLITVLGSRGMLTCSPLRALQCNHRSWADFMVDQYVTEGRSLFMSRIAVAWVFPMFMLPMWAIRCVILFKRGSIADKDVRFTTLVLDKEFHRYYFISPIKTCVISACRLSING